jgi:GTP-binding protein EngB required for normal cell division
VLLSKADKLSRGEAQGALRTATGQLAGRATVQLFSAVDGTGLREAQDMLEKCLAQ